jgi:hypothetical protein
VVTGDDTEAWLAGVGEDGTDAAPAQMSTATNPTLRRRPHDECQARPGTALWSVGGTPLCVRSPRTAISPPANSVIGCSSGLSSTRSLRPACPSPPASEMGRRVHFRTLEGLVRLWEGRGYVMGITLVRTAGVGAWA